VQVQKQHDEFRRRGATVLIVTPSKPESVRTIKMPFEVLCDPDRVAYRFFGLERGGMSMFFNGRVIWHYIRLIISGLWPHFPVAGEDLYQLGGDFVLSADRRLLFAYRSLNPADRPTVGDLIQLWATTT
jgi:hypothetical protein